MKNIILLVSLILLSGSCTDDSDNIQSNPLLGVWSKTDAMEDSNLTESLQYKFNSDGTLVVSVVVTDNAISETIGFTYRALGTYSYTDNLLDIDLPQIYHQSDSSELFSSIDDLELSNQSAKVTIPFSINENRLILTYGRCPVNAQCDYDDPLTLLKTD